MRVSKLERLVRIRITARNGGFCDMGILVREAISGKATCRGQSGRSGGQTGVGWSRLVIRKVGHGMSKHFLNTRQPDTCQKPYTCHFPFASDKMCLRSLVSHEATQGRAKDKERQASKCCLNQTVDRERPQRPLQGAERGNSTRSLLSSPFGSSRNLIPGLVTP